MLEHITIDQILNATEEELQNYENELLKCVQRTEDEYEFMIVCSLLTAIGSGIAIPTLMAVLKDARGEQAEMIVETLLHIKSRMTGWKEETMKQLFDPQWWVTKWVGSRSGLLSFVFAISQYYNKTDEFEESMDILGETIVKEMCVDISPFDTFHDFRICTNDWESEDDVRSLINNSKGDSFLFNSLEGTDVDIDPESHYEYTIQSMRMVYLITRLKLTGDPDELRYLLTIAMSLNTVE